MNGGDEFEDFLSRRKPLFQQPADLGLEPPEDVDRLVLRQAREAIKPARHMHEIRGAGWGMPLALAATLLVAFTIVLNVMAPRKPGDAASDVHAVAERREAPGATAGISVSTPAPNNSTHAAGSETLAGVQQPAGRRAPTAAQAGPAPSPPSTSAAPQDGARAAAKASSAPPWRRDAQSWLAQIDRLRAQGKGAEADAELAEYKREHRAYASGPDR
jgi:hypothetical protein